MREKKDVEDQIPQPALHSRGLLHSREDEDQQEPEHAAEVVARMVADAEELESEIPETLKLKWFPMLGFP